MRLPDRIAQVRQLVHDEARASGEGSELHVAVLALCVDVETILTPEPVDNMSGSFDAVVRRRMGWD